MKRILLLVGAAGLLAPAVATATDSTVQWFRPGKWGHSSRPILRSRVRLGLEITPMTPQLRKFFGAPEDRGVLVGRVMADSPAEKAGVKVGDVVVDANGRAVRGLRDLLRGKWRQGGRVKLGIFRSRQRTEIVARIPKSKDGFQRFFRGGPRGFFGGKGRGFFGGKRGKKFEWFAPGHLREEMGKLRERLRKLEKRLDQKKARKPI